MTYDPKRSRPRPGPSADAAPVDAILGGPDDEDAQPPRTVEAPAVTPPPIGSGEEPGTPELPTAWLDAHRNEAVAAAVVAALILVLVMRMRRSDGD